MYHKQAMKGYIRAAIQTAAAFEQPRKYAQRVEAAIKAFEASPTADNKRAMFAAVHNGMIDKSVE